MDHLRRSLRNGFAAEPLDRAAGRRDDEAWVRAALERSSSRFVPVRDGDNLFDQDHRPRWLTRDEITSDVLRSELFVYLGQQQDQAVFALRLSKTAVGYAQRLERGARFRDLWGVGALLQDDDAAILAYARGLCVWHDRHGFCSSCGSPTDSVRGGHARRCRNSRCAAISFPRTDPAVIVLVGDGGRCLLGRQNQWPAGMFSTIAGFVEPAETLEHAVLREVKEETNIDLGEVEYHSSQPWPFPASIMLGFTARPSSYDIRLDDELEDARWFTPAQVRRAIAGNGDVRVPPSHSIAHRLISDWLACSQGE